MQHYVLVDCVEGRFLTTDLTDENLVPAMEVRGFAPNGTVCNGYMRKELQGQPRFRGLNGPMWGGTRNGQPLIRYETIEAYRELST